MSSPFTARESSAAEVRHEESSTSRVRVGGKAPANDAPNRRERRRIERLRALVSSVSDLALSPELRNLLDAQLPDDDAVRAGTRCTSVDVLDDLLDALSPAVVQSVRDEEVPGFGPATLRYTVDLGVELEQQARTRQQHARAHSSQATARDAGATAVSSLRVTLGRRLDAALVANAPERSACDAARAMPSRTLNQKVHALEAMLAVADDLLARAEGDTALAALLRDQQFTRARIDALVAPVMPMLDAKGAARAAADQQALVQRSIDRLEGRLRDQLLRLRRLVAQQNDDGVAVTKVRVTRTRASQRRVKADTQPQPAPTSDHTP